jgi:hypothetical protein
MNQRRRKPLILGMTVLSLIVAGVSVGNGLQRRADYLALAEYHLGEMAAFDSARRSDGELADMFEGKAPQSPMLAFLNPGDPVKIRSSESINAQRAAYHSALSRKYQQAADRPWSSVEPDPLSP